MCKVVVIFLKGNPKYYEGRYRKWYFHIEKGLQYFLNQLKRNSHCKIRFMIFQLELEIDKKNFSTFVDNLVRNDIDYLVIVSHSRGTCFQPKTKHDKLLKICLGLTWCKTDQCDIYVRNRNELDKQGRPTINHYKYNWKYVANKTLEYIENLRKK